MYIIINSLLLVIISLDGSVREIALVADSLLLPVDRVDKLSKGHLLDGFHFHLSRGLLSSPVLGTQERRVARLVILIGKGAVSGACMLLQLVVVS